jgi:hypothetical protein
MTLRIMKNPANTIANMTHTTTQPVNELVDKLRKLTSRGMSHQQASRLWGTATQLMNNSARRFASEAKFCNGQWILISCWREHETDMARALRDLAMVKQIAIGIRSGLLEDEDSHFFDLQHLESVICAIDELQHHPRFSRLRGQTLNNELQPA